MSDLVERLRAYALVSDSDVLINEAAAEIERLGAKCEKAHIVLEAILHWGDGCSRGASIPDKYIRAARRAVSTEV